MQQEHVYTISLWYVVDIWCIGKILPVSPFLWQIHCAIAFEHNGSQLLIRAGASGRAARAIALPHFGLQIYLHYNN